MLRVPRTGRDLSGQDPSTGANTVSDALREVANLRAGQAGALVVVLSGRHGEPLVHPIDGADEVPLEARPLHGGVQGVVVLIRRAVEFDAGGEAAHGGSNSRSEERGETR